MKVCVVTICGGRATRKGYCQSHYDRLRRTGDPEGFTPRKKRAKPALDGFKWCNACGIEKETSEFYTKKDKAGIVQLRQDCKLCWNAREAIRRKNRTPEQIEKYRNQSREHARKLRTEDPDRSRNLKFKRMYGITVEEYYEIAEKQGYRCAICRSSYTTSGRTYYDVDHDHNTGKVRGLLCGSCNRGLGMFRDNLNSLRAAVEYLEMACV